MQRVLVQLESAITRLEGRTAPRDALWEPVVPPGHTSFSWTGVLGQPGFVQPHDPKAPVSKRQVKSKPDSEERQASPFASLDVRVGRVLSALVHPSSDNLLVEQIDLGEKEPRQIVSGIAQTIPIDQFVGALVLVVCNLKRGLRRISRV
jgi:hypothetical protein